MTKKVIVVEDDPVAARYLELCLRRLGYQDFRMAASSEEALELAAAQVPQLVLMDIEIEGNPDGVETAIALRERFNVPSIFLTSRSDEMTLARAKRAEPLGYLVKPIKLEDLRTTLAVGMHKERLNREAKQRELQAREGIEPQVRRLRAELALQATHDETTGLLNLRGLSLVGEYQLRLMRRLRSAVSLLRVELLNLTDIDKEFGADAAVQATKDLAAILTSLQRDGDLSARLDAAHFVLLTSGTNTVELTRRVGAAIDRYNATTARGWQLVALSDTIQSSAKREITIHELLHLPGDDPVEGSVPQRD